jgi:hypothetical protein
MKKKYDMEYVTVEITQTYSVPIYRTPALHAELSREEFLVDSLEGMFQEGVRQFQKDYVYSPDGAVLEDERGTLIIESEHPQLDESFKFNIGY